MSIYFVGYFTDGGAPRTGLSPLPVITIYKISDNIAVVSAASTTEIAGGGYKYLFSGYDVTEDYYAIMDGGVALPDSERYVYGCTLITNEQINAEIVDCINVDTYAEPGQEIPGDTISLAKKLGYLYKFWRNKNTRDLDGNIEIYNSGGNIVDHKTTAIDDNITFEKGKYVSGP